MHVVGEVERRRAARQIDDLAAWAQRVHAVFEQLRLQSAEQVRDRAIAGRRLEQLPQPGDFRLLGAAKPAAFLVVPVCRDAELGVLVHLPRTDLDLERQLTRSDDGRVERLVVVLLGRCDVIVEFTGHVVPATVHETECRVAVGDRADDDAHREHVHDLLEREALALHLAPDAVDVLRAAADLGDDARRAEVAFELASNVVDVALAFLRLARSHPAIRLYCSLAVAEGEVLELPFQLPDSEPVCERGIDLTCLERGSSLLLAARRLERPHAGQLDGQPHEHQAHVRREREQQPAQPFRLFRLEFTTRRPFDGYSARIDARMLPRKLQRCVAAPIRSVLVANRTGREHRHKKAGQLHVVVDVQVSQNRKYGESVRQGLGRCACSQSLDRMTYVRRKVIGLQCSLFHAGIRPAQFRCADGATMTLS